MKKDHYLEVTGYIAVVQTVFDDFRSYGREVPEAAAAALQAAVTWLEGNDMDEAALQAAVDLSFEEGVPLAKREKDRALAWARTAAGNLAWLAKKDRGWQNAGQTVMDAAENALSSLGIPGVKDRDPLEVLRLAAMLNAKPPVKKPPKKNVKVLSTNLSAFIGAKANRSLAMLKPVFDLDRRGNEDELCSLLKLHNFPIHKTVLEFDKRYGGLIVADSPGEEGYDWIFGAFAVLKSKAHLDPHGEQAWLVPVAYSPNDYIFYLDQYGVAWMDDTVGDAGTERFAEDADSMMAKIFSKEI
jgi:hypothetical protein